MTGASSGIGRAAALDFAFRSTSVMVATRPGDALADLVSEMERNGGTGWLANLSMKLMPEIIERMMAVIVNEQEIPGTSTPSTSGNLFEPANDDPRVSGGWRDPSESTWSGVLARLVGAGAVIFRSSPSPGGFG